MLKCSWILLFALLVPLMGCRSTPSVAYPPTANSQDELSILTKDLMKAEAAQWNVIAPAAFADSRRYLDGARAARARSTDLYDFWQEMGRARYAYDQARLQVEQRKSLLRPVLSARAGALNGGARSGEDDVFTRADARLTRLAERLPRHIVSAREQADLIADYRRAEVEGVQNQKLAYARGLVHEARQNGGKRYAPASLAAAEMTLARAERAIASQPRRSAAYSEDVNEAERAGQLAVAVTVRARTLTTATPEIAARELVARDAELANTRGELKGAELEVAVKSRALVESTKQLNEREAELRTERAMNEALAQVREKIGPNEADVFRKGDKLLIQLKSVGFTSGSARLPEPSKSLLTKVKGVLKDLNPQDVVVEGHTDKTGSPTVNSKVSKARAEAVASFLGDVIKDVEARSADADPSGDLSPSAKTRASNRRVDLIVTPAKL